MRNLLFITFGILIAISSVLFLRTYKFENPTGAPPYNEGDLEPPEENQYSEFINWKRPDVPPKVGLQIGHWKNSELPDELERLRGNSGATGGGVAEWEVNKIIGEITADILEKAGIQVEIIPATVPEKFWADAFIAIHADGSLDTTKSGFKLASPRRDFTGNALSLKNHIEREYQKSTSLVIDPNVTRNMRGYYAFAWWRYNHAVHPMTPSVILETGFLSSPQDRKTIVTNPEKSATGLANGVINFLKEEGVLVEN